MKFLVIILFFIAHECYGLGCSQSDAVMDKLSKEYEQAIHIKTNERAENYNITIQVPKIIKNSNFHSIYVVKENFNKEREDFVFPISMTDKDESKEGWFNIDKVLFDNIFLHIMYGADCGFSIKKSVSG